MANSNYFDPQTEQDQGAARPSQPQPKGQETSAVDEWRGWMEKPNNRAALMQFGVAMLQPLGFGESVLSHGARAVGSAGEASARVEEQDLAERKASSEEELRAARADAAASNANTAAERLLRMDEALRIRREDVGSKIETRKGTLEVQRQKGETDSEYKKRSLDLRQQEAAQRGDQFDRSLEEKRFDRERKEQEGFTRGDQRQQRLEQTGEAVKQGQQRVEQGQQRIEQQGRQGAARTATETERLGIQKQRLEQSQNYLPRDRMLANALLQRLHRDYVNKANDFSNPDRGKPIMDYQEWVDKKANKDLVAIARGAPAPRAGTGGTNAPGTVPAAPSGAAAPAPRAQISPQEIMQRPQFGDIQRLAKGSESEKGEARRRLEALRAKGIDVGPLYTTIGLTP